MRPGPSTVDLAGAVSVGVEVASHLGRTVLATSMPVWDVKVEATADRVVPSQLTLMADPELVPASPHDALANFGQRLQVTSLVEVAGRLERVPVGWFQISEWEERDDGIQVTARDLFTLVDADRFAWPSSPPAGSTLLSELRRLCEQPLQGAGLPVILEASDRAIPRSFQWGVSKSEAVRDLCASYGLAYGVKPDGYLHVWEQPTGARVVAAYTAEDLLGEARRKSVDRVPNRWIVAGSPEGDDKVKWTSVVENFAGDYRPDTYGIVTDRREFNVATSADAVRKAAETYQANALNQAGTRSLGIVFDPRLELGDDITAQITHDDGQVERITGRVVALSATLDKPDALMRVDVKELYW